MKEFKCNELKLPEYSEWVCAIFGGNDGIYFRPTKGKHPNAFWRFMQYVCFGHRWEKDRGVK